jgi:hypothetical protein
MSPPPHSQHRPSGTSTPGADRDPDLLAENSLSLIGRTKSGRLITAVELNQNILLVQKELVKLTLAVESNPRLHPSSAAAATSEDPVSLDSCGCVLS